MALQLRPAHGPAVGRRRGPGREGGSRHADPQGRQLRLARLRRHALHQQRSVAVQRRASSRRCSSTDTTQDAARSRAATCIAAHAARCPQGPTSTAITARARSSPGMAAAQNLLLDDGRSLVSFGEDEQGELYVVDIGGTVSALSPDAGAATSAAVEFFHAGFGHYFSTSSPDEIAKLDAGVFAGWARTGESFKVYPAASPGQANVCRFFSARFDPKSSHFYTPLANECAIVKQNGNWQFEGEVFAVALPDAAGTCTSDTLPLFRLYNNGQGAAPNHRYTTKLEIRAAMLSQGWISEGTGNLGVIACVPRDASRAALRPAHRCAAERQPCDGRFAATRSVPCQAHATAHRSGSPACQNAGRRVNFPHRLRCVFRCAHSRPLCRLPPSSRGSRRKWRSHESRQCPGRAKVDREYADTRSPAPETLRPPHPAARTRDASSPPHPRACGPTNATP